MSHIDGALNLLSNSHRRYVLQFLQDKEEATVETLAKEIAAKDDTTKKQARIALVHKHLPKLADHDIIAYDQETVELLETPSELDPLFEIDAANTQATY